MSASARRADPAPADSPEAVARLEGVSFGYGAGRPVLRDVNLTLAEGSFHFLTGPSGAGKSSLLKLLTLQLRPTAGRVWLFDEDTARLPPRLAHTVRRRMGVVHQDHDLLDHLSVWRNAALPLELAGGRAAEYGPDVEEMLAWVGLQARMGARPSELSGGERQRLAIARAVVARPRLILADEPTGSVDAAMAERLLKLFQSMNRLGTTVLIATHDQVLADRSGATVLRLIDGGLRA